MLVLMLGVLVSKADASPGLQGAYVLGGKTVHRQVRSMGRKVRQGSVWAGAVCRVKCH